jgi:hypothetical protein
MPGGTGGPHRIQGVGFWAQQKYYNIFSVDSGPFIFRPPLKGLPEQPSPPNAFQWWAQNPSIALLHAPATNVVFRDYWRGLPEQPPLPLLQQSSFQSYPVLYTVVAALPVPLGKQPTDLPQLPWRLDQTWTRSYNLNLIGQDAMLAGEQRYELAPSQVPPEQIQLHSWAWSYNLSLVGKDRLPTGKQTTELTIGQRPPEQIQLHSWSWQYNLNLIGQDQLITGEQVTDLPPRDPREVRTWSWQYNLNLVGQDRFPTGEQSWERPTLPIPPAAPTWAWQYNSNLIGQDLLPFRQLDWPNPIAPGQPALSWTSPLKVWLTAPALNISISQYWDRPQLPVPPAQTWTWSYNLNLIGQDHMLTGEQVYELAPSQKVPEQIQLHSWQWWYNLNLIGRDRLPTGEQIYELAPPTKPYEQSQLHSWQWSYNLNLVGKDQLPTGEQISDLAPGQKPYRIDPTWTWSYNLNLIGQDRMATGEQSTDLPPRDYQRLFQTWINTVNLALVTAPPNLYAQARQQDWPLPRGIEPDWRRSWESWYNLNLIGKDQLPIRQSDWPLPAAGAPLVQTWIDRTRIQLAVVQNPFFQTDWPIPQAPQQPAQSWASSYNLNLIGQDQLPNRQSDWPLTPAAQRAADLATWINRVQWQLFKPFAQLDWPNPTPFARDPTLATIAASYNRNLVGQDRLPNRQQDWPLSSAHALSQIPLQIMVAGKPFYLVPPQPLPPGVQFHGILYDRFIDPARGAADLGWPAWRWPQITPPPVSAIVPLRTLMGTGV